MSCPPRPSNPLIAELTQQRPVLRPTTPSTPSCRPSGWDSLVAELNKPRPIVWIDGPRPEGYVTPPCSTAPAAPRPRPGPGFYCQPDVLAGTSVGSATASDSSTASSGYVPYVPQQAPAGCGSAAGVPLPSSVCEYPPSVNTFSYSEHTMHSGSSCASDGSSQSGISTWTNPPGTPGILYTGSCSGQTGQPPAGGPGSSSSGSGQSQPGSGAGAGQSGASCASVYSEQTVNSGQPGWGGWGVPVPAGSVYTEQTCGSTAQPAGGLSGQASRPALPPLRDGNMVSELARGRDGIWYKWDGRGWVVYEARPPPYPQQGPSGCGSAAGNPLPVSVCSAQPAVSVCSAQPAGGSVYTEQTCGSTGSGWGPWEVQDGYTLPGQAPASCGSAAGNPLPSSVCSTQPACGSVYTEQTCPSSVNPSTWPYTEDDDVLGNVNPCPPGMECCPIDPISPVDPPVDPFPPVWPPANPPEPDQPPLTLDECISACNDSFPPSNNDEFCSSGGIDPPKGDEPSMPPVNPGPPEDPFPPAWPPANPDTPCPPGMECCPIDPPVSPVDPPVDPVPPVDPPVNPTVPVPPDPSSCGMPPVDPPVNPSCGVPVAPDPSSGMPTACGMPDLPPLPPEALEADCLDKCRRFSELMRQNGCAGTVVCRKRRSDTTPGSASGGCGCEKGSGCGCKKRCVLVRRC